MYASVCAKGSTHGIRFWVKLDSKNTIRYNFNPAFQQTTKCLQNAPGILLYSRKLGSCLSILQRDSLGARPAAAGKRSNIDGVVIGPQDFGEHTRVAMSNVR